MDNREKLKHLLGHWSEHNTEHVKTYRKWAQKAEEFGNRELSKVLNELADETARADELFKKAERLL